MEELVQHILSLDSKVNLVNQNVQFNISLMWAIFGVSIAIAGAALVILARTWVDKSVKRELNLVTTEVENLKKSTNDIQLTVDNIINKNNNLIISSGGDGWGYIHFCEGTHICYLRTKVEVKHKCVRSFIFPIAFDNDDRVVPTVSVLNSKDIIANVESVTEGGISVIFNSLSSSQAVENIEVSIMAIGKFENK